MSRFTLEGKEEKKQLAWQLKMNGADIHSIAKSLSITPRTVSRYLDEVRDTLKKERSTREMADDLVSFIAAMDNIILRANTHLREVKTGSPAAATFLQQIMKAEEKKAQALGLLDKVRITGADGVSPVDIAHHHFNWNIIKEVGGPSGQSDRISEMRQSFLPNPDVIEAEFQPSEEE